MTRLRAVCGPNGERASFGQAYCPHGRRVCIPRKEETLVASELAAAAVQALEKHPDCALVLTGGDTAAAVCRELSCAAVDLGGEIGARDCLGDPGWRPVQRDAGGIKIRRVWKGKFTARSSSFFVIYLTGKHVLVFFRCETAQGPFRSENHLLFFQGGYVAFRKSLGPGFQYPPHDFSAARLWQLRNNGDLFRSGDRANFMAYMRFQLIHQRIALLPARPLRSHRREWHSL